MDGTITLGPLLADDAGIHNGLTPEEASGWREVVVDRVLVGDLEGTFKIASDENDNEEQRAAECGTIISLPVFSTDTI